MKLAAKAELPDNYKDDLYTEDRKSTSSTEYENSWFNKYKQDDIYTMDWKSTGSTTTFY